MIVVYFCGWAATHVPSKHAPRQLAVGYLLYYCNKFLGMSPRGCCYPTFLSSLSSNTGATEKCFREATLLVIIIIIIILLIFEIHVYRRGRNEISQLFSDSQECVIFYWINRGCNELLVIIVVNLFISFVWIWKRKCIKWDWVVNVSVWKREKRRKKKTGFISMLEGNDNIFVQRPVDYSF